MRIGILFFVGVALCAAQSSAAPAPHAVAAIENLAAAQGKKLRVRWSQVSGQPTSIAGLKLALRGKTLQEKVTRFGRLHPRVLVTTGSDLAFDGERASHTRRLRARSADGTNFALKVAGSCIGAAGLVFQFLNKSQMGGEITKLEISESDTVNTNAIPLDCPE